MEKVITFGEIMLRLAPSDFLRFSQAISFDVLYGGGESNVAVSLANYHVPVEFVTRLPKNDIGQCALMEMRKRGVGTQHIIEGGNRLGIYFLETGAVSRGSKVVYDRANSTMSEITPGMVDWKEVFKDAQWFHWTGITPAISQSAADACLEAVKVASKMRVTISTDLNYRAKLWNYGGDREKIMTALTSYCDIILGNEEDAEMHFGVKPEGLDITTQGKDIKAKSFLSVCKQMQTKFPRAKKIITTLRGSISASYNTWAGLLYDGKKIMKVLNIKLQIS
jgi:2-dehydro-3-deoxygluconokinase|tara:strand:+ start:199 stop:1035 length:837 start_codon:yes stop_codon:yes gene_type:complete